MPTYIRSKINTSTPVDIIIESEGSITKFRQDGTFKIPTEIPGSDLGSLRYHDGRLETLEITGWQALSTNSVINTQINLAINALIDNAPAALNTLNELAAALNDDANFSSTITNLISGKLNKSGDTMTGALILADDPVNALESATKQYVDTATSSIEVTSTNDVPEGDNLYFTMARARNSISVGGDLSYNSSTGIISYSYALPTASTSTLGGVKVDGTTITINNGVISGANTYVLPTATTSALGGVKVDGTTITINNGVISSSQSVTGNAGTVTNGVYTTGSYSDPSWITSLAYSKLTGTPTTISGYGITNAYTKTEVDSAILTAITTKDNTDEITEGNTNKYYTDARARSSISAGYGIIYDNTTGVISFNNNIIATKAYLDGRIASVGITVDNLADTIGAYIATNSVSMATLIQLIDSLSTSASATARSAVSAGNGINYNSNTGVMSLANTATLDGGTY